ncbi:hypothetical protein [Streptomyces lavendofoliae]|uniref:hypothetical protein n=1 Tax=Streptomyces lavendofoliae TaxID=67314 RepID=UPI003D90FB08
MKNMLTAGALSGALALSIVGAGSSAAASATPHGEGGVAAAVAQGFFTPGSNTVVKVNADYKGPTTPGGATKRSATDTYVPTVRNVTRHGQSCGTNVIQQVSGRGKTTLVMTVEKSVTANVKKDFSIDLKYISGGMGWDVTKTYTVKNETRYEVPKGKMGTVEAYPLYDLYIGVGHDRFGTPLGKVYAYKPIGVCFNQHLS